MKSIEISPVSRKEEYISPSTIIVTVKVEHILMGSDGRNGDNESTEEEDLF